jgi:two-component system, LuxR family, response regulator FixJ
MTTRMFVSNQPCEWLCWSAAAENIAGPLARRLRRSEPARMEDAKMSQGFSQDDDPQVRDALSVVFSLEGYQVTSFGDGQALLNATRSRVPACIILDVQMPGRSGLDILKELNAQDCAAPIFIISGQGDIPMAVDAIKNGALDFIEKPFNAETVVSRVREAIEARERRKEAGSSSGALALPFPGRDTLTPA